MATIARPPLITRVERRGPAQDWFSLNLLQTTLGAIARPFVLTDWPNPRSASPTIDLRTWMWVSQFHLPPDFLPRAPLLLRRESLRYHDLYSWSDNLLLTTLGKQTPFTLTDWPNPMGVMPSVVLRTWIDHYKILLQSQDTFFGAPGQPPTYEWPVPSSRVHPMNLRTWAENALNLLTSIIVVFPFALFDWPNPLVRMADPERWTLLVNLLESTLGVVGVGPAGAPLRKKFKSAIARVRMRKPRCTR